jgi:uncharacterized Zn finger protein (UPF0148 family)
MNCSKCGLALFKYRDGVLSCKNGHRFSEGDPYAVPDRTELEEYREPAPVKKSRAALFGALAGAGVVLVDVLIRAIT